MKQIVINHLVVAAIAVSTVFTSCDKTPDTGIESISIENYPRVDGSTSAEPLNLIIAAKLLGVEYVVSVRKLIRCRYTAVIRNFNY